MFGQYCRRGNEKWYRTHSQMSQLPCARQEEHDDLCYAVPYSARIRHLGEVTEISLALALILLLATDFFDFDVQVADLARERRDVPAIILHVGLG